MSADGSSHVPASKIQAGRSAPDRWPRGVLEFTTRTIAAQAAPGVSGRSVVASTPDRLPEATTKAATQARGDWSPAGPVHRTGYLGQTPLPEGFCVVSADGDPMPVLVDDLPELIRVLGQPGDVSDQHEVRPPARPPPQQEPHGTASRRGRRARPPQPCQPAPHRHDRPHASRAARDPSPTIVRWPSDGMSQALSCPY